ncbi:MAG: hypothetical protein Q8K78_15935 [Planctomycetaceae bacterium]|nr:hypothetical protein [Planctomycetaceae bacterium]
MSGVWTTVRIRQEIDQLADRRDELATALAQSAGKLETAGLVPEDDLLTELTDYRQRMRSLASHITGRAFAVDVRLSLKHLDEQFDQSQQRETLVRQLDGIMALMHVDIPDYAPLKRCREDARRCQQRLVSALEFGNDEQARFLSREHELQAVLTLSNQSSALTDEDWNRLHDLVARTYGRGLATALVRGRIQRSTEAVSEPELISSVAISPTIPSAPLVTDDEMRSDPHAAMATDLDTATRWLLSGSSILPGVSTTKPPADMVDDESPEIKPDTSSPAPNSPSIVIDLDLPKPVWHKDDAARLAREILAESPRTAVRLNALIRQLIRDDRVALAAHLARCGERLPSGRGIVPSSGLLRALVLGRSLSYARGELARDVEQELKPFATSSQAATAGDDERLGLGFFQRAAALLPALLGASSAASTVLRSFAIEPGLSHLYNYCSRVAAFGERLQSQAVELFQAPAEQTQWQAERQQLEVDIRDWLAQAVKRSVPYQRSSPLFLHAHWTVLASPTQRHPHAVMEWARWQEVLLLAHRLLSPMSKGTAERSVVRSELSRAVALLQTESAEQATTKPSGGRGLIPLTGSMQEILLEAINLGNRWLRLQSSTPTRGLQLAPQQAEELRTELLERTGGVMAELDVLARTRSADIVQTGVAVCRRVVEHIRRLCAGELPLALHEPDARHVLNDEFLKMPHVELNEHWQPIGEAGELEQAILEHIRSGWMDWQSAFALQCQQEDHLATSRVLELPVWSDPAVLSELHRLRGQELQRTRHDVLRDLDELASRVAMDVSEHPELESRLEEINQRIQRLRMALPQVLSFAPVRARLDRYRNRWERLVMSDESRSAQTEPVATDDSGILPPLPTLVPVATETAEATTEGVEQWVFLEE